MQCNMCPWAANGWLLALQVGNILINLGQVRALSHRLAVQIQLFLFPSSLTPGLLCPPTQNIMKLGINKREALEVPEAEKPSIM
jgi:hypothetical protein